MTPRRRAKRAASAGGANPTAVLLEDLYGQMKVVIEAVQGCATKADLERLASKADLEPFALKSDLKGLASKADLEPLALKSDLKGLASKADLEPFALKSDLKGLASKADLEPLALKADVEALRTEMDRGFSSVTTRLGTLSAEVARKADGAALDGLERRVSAIEGRLGL
jgi:hypothetical protein